MENKKPVIHINPPPRDGSCEICNRKFDDLPLIEKDLKPIPVAGKKLIKNFRNFCGWVSASWECIDCFGKPVKWETPGASVDDFAETD